MRQTQHRRAPKGVRPRFSRRRHYSFDSLEQRTLLAAPTIIDVMVVYDANAKNQLGGTDAVIQKLIRQSIDSANQAHYNTGDNVVLRLVHTEQISYSSSGDIATDLNRLQNPADGFMDNVHTLRNTFGADLVSLISTPTFQGGLANLLTSTSDPNRATLAFSVISASAIGPGSFVMGHEMAHNMGAGHERDNLVDPTPNPVFPYAFGYHFTGNNGNEYGDVMSYQGLQLPYFSNPNIIYQGQPLGKPIGDLNAADLLDTFLITAPVVAAYRASVTTDTSPPVPTIYQEDLNGKLLTFTVRYQDDVAVNASTLGNGDVYVQTPEGFHLNAELLSLDKPGDGYAKLATYRVTLPDSNPPQYPPLTSLQFFLNANQVKDVNNNTTPAGPIANNVDFDIDRFSFQAARDTGALTPPTTRVITGGLSTGDTQDFYKFTVTQPTAFSVNLSGLASTAQVFLMADLNGNDVFDAGNNEQLTGTNTAGTVDRGFSMVLQPGVYDVLVQLNGGQPATPYTLTVRNYTDTVAPTATLDAVDTVVPTSNLTFSVIYSDDNDLDPTSVKINALVAFNVAFTSGGGFTGHTGSPNSITTLSTGQIVANYNVNLGSSLLNGTVTLTVFSGADVRDAAGNQLSPGSALGTYKLAGNPVLPDSTVPTVSLVSAPGVFVPGGAGYDFVVAYKDNRAINASTLDNNDWVVTGPGGFSQPALFVSSTTSPGGAFRYATYHITPPGGSWDWHDDGFYQMNLQANQVRDTNTNPVAPISFGGALGVIIPFPGDANGDGKTDFADLVALAQNYNAYGRGVATGDFNYDGIVDFTDLVTLAQNYGGMLPSAPSPSPIVSASPQSAAAKPTTSTKRPTSTSKPQPAISPQSLFAKSKITRKRLDVLS